MDDERPDIVDRLRARRTTRSSVTVDGYLRYDIDDAISEIEILRRTVRNLTGGQLVDAVGPSDKPQWKHT